MTWQQVDKVEKTVIWGGLAEDDVPPEGEVRIKLEETTSRLPAPGGWLHRSLHFDVNGSVEACALAFVPDECV